MLYTKKHRTCMTTNETLLAKYRCHQLSNKARAHKERAQHIFPHHFIGKSCITSGNHMYANVSIHTKM